MSSIESDSANKKHAFEDASNISSSVAPPPKKVKDSHNNPPSMAEIEAKITAATTDNVKTLLKSIYLNISRPPMGLLYEFLTYADTRSKCFCCGSKKKQLEDLGELAVCSGCTNSNLSWHRTELKEHFGLSKSDTEAISHSTGVSNWGGAKYTYKQSSVIAAIKYHHISKVQRYKRKHFWGNSDKDYRKASTNEEKQRILDQAASAVSKSVLKTFAVNVLNKTKLSEEVLNILKTTL